MRETHILLEPRQPGTLEQQLQALEKAYELALGQLGVNGRSAVLRRIFASDLINQHGRIIASPLASQPPLSLVEQPPLPEGKVALFAYHVDDPAAAASWQVAEDGAEQWNRCGRTHLLVTGLKAPGEPGSYEQTLAVFKQLEERLDARDMTLADHAMRTWIYVKNLDTDYRGVVRARKEFFAARGLTPETHFIASTGIAGGAEDADVHITLDAYAVKGLCPRQIRHLEALDHLSPTHLYGVTFERGTAVFYGDRHHVLLSGTASIDAKGRIVHERDVLGQLERTLENMAALLDAGEASLDDLTHALVYLRDGADHSMVRQAVKERFPHLPCLYLRAPVCRPGWLIELEATAVVCRPHEGFEPF